jgi:hypothetical protein
MGLLAYDPGRLGALRAAVGTALDDLRGIRCDDPEAATAMTAVHNATRTLCEFCVPRIEDILNSDAMTSYHKVKLDKNDVRQALVFTMADAYKWRISSDPFEDDTTIVTTAEARALGARLQSGNLGKLTDQPEELAFIAQQLKIINGDPQLRAEYLANFTKLDKLADTLAERRLELATEDKWFGRGNDRAAELASIDATFAELTHLYQCRQPASAGPYPGWVNGVQPFTAALLLRTAGLDPVTLGRVSNDLIVRWYRDQPDQRFTDLKYDGPDTADILFQTILATPGAATAYVRLAAIEPEPMFFSATDPLLAQQVALQGTDPSNIAPEDAARVLIALIQFSQNDAMKEPIHFDANYPTDYAAFLGDLVGPWLLQFSVDNHDWNYVLNQVDDRSALLAMVAADEKAFEKLIVSFSATVNELVTRVKATGATDHDTKEFAALIGMLGERIVHQKFANELQRQKAWDGYWAVADDGLSLLPVPAIVGVVLTKALDKAKSAVKEQGLLGAPQPDNVRDHAQYELDWTVAFTTATVATALCAQLGFAPTDMPPEPDKGSSDPKGQYEHDYDRWLEEQKAAGNASRVEIVEQWKAMMISPYDAGTSTVR